MKKFNSIQEVISKNILELNKVYKIKIDGKEHKAPFTNRKCVYYEIATLFFNEKGVNLGFFNNYHSTDDLTVILEDNKCFNIYVNQLRPYLYPSYRNIITDIKRINKIKEEIFDGENYEHFIDIEFILEKDKEYYGLIGTETYYLPPEEPKGRPIKEFSYVLLLSDKGFINGKPQGDLTPYYIGFTY